jgi:hypothetical protein
VVVAGHRRSGVGEAEDLDERTVEELRDRARELGIEGRSDLSKSELVDAIRNH